MRDPTALLACVSCGRRLTQEGDALRCDACGSLFPIVDGIPILLGGDLDELRDEQAAYFDEHVDDEFEIERPSGAPGLYTQLLGDKFRRATAGLVVTGRTALTVCGGSGMDAEFLAAAGACVISSDVSLGACRRAQERSRRHSVPFGVIVADATRLPFPDRSIDIVYVHDGLHHLEHPVQGLAEMARVARSAVCVTEPAQAAATRLAVRVGLALEREEAGNAVVRLSLDDVRSTLSASGFEVTRATRYGMFYRQAPGRLMRLLSHQPLLTLSAAALHFANAVAGGIGNKLAVQAVRTDL